MRVIRIIPNTSGYSSGARYYRVVEAQYTAVTSSSHTNLATRVLGEAPILPDGSVYFEAPADTPLYLEPLDAAGQRIEFAWNYPETSVPEGSRQTLTELAYVSARPGELRVCHGCHAPQDEAGRHTGDTLALVRDPVQVDRDVDRSDLSPQRTGRVSQHGPIRGGSTVRSVARPCGLGFATPGCEALMTVEDGGREQAAAIAELAP